MLIPMVLLQTANHGVEHFGEFFEAGVELGLRIEFNQLASIKHIYYCSTFEHRAPCHYMKPSFIGTRIPPGSFCYIKDHAQCRTM